VTNQKSLSPGRRSGNVYRKWQSRLRPAGEWIGPARVRMVRTVASSMCMSALLVTGCEYAPQPSHPAAAPAPASTLSPTAATSSLKGKTELNKYHLAVQYTCAEGDTLETVAREFGIKAEILRTFNPSVTLKAGAVIDVRGEDVPQLGAGGPFVPNADGTATYTVQAEDTYLGISSRFGVPGYALRGANTALRGIEAELTAAPGQKLTIPSIL
jgi:LysM repeat protein